MRRLGFAFTMFSALVCGLGCSQGTVEKADEAVDSAASDVAGAVEGAGDAVEKAADDMVDAVEGE